VSDVQPAAAQPGVVGGPQLEADDQDGEDRADQQGVEQVADLDIAEQVVSSRLLTHLALPTSAPVGQLSCAEQLA
jgi:hypothetical protein